MKTVLIADDQRSLRLLLRATLGRGGFRVLEAADGAEAVETARRERPDLVLLDVGMPRLDGLAACRMLKADPATANIPILMLTARAQQADRDEGIEAGADAYFTKPFKPSELQAIVSQAIG